MASSPVHIVFPGLEWKSGSGEPIPPSAIEGGFQSSREPLYVGRVLAPDGKYHPAKLHIISGITQANFCYNNEEKNSSTYDVLVCTDINPLMASDEVVEWVKVSASEKPPANAVQAHGNELYIGRHKAENEMVIGEVNLMAAEHKCIVVTGLKAFDFSEYEVLCARRQVGELKREEDQFGPFHERELKREDYPFFGTYRECEPEREGYPFDTLREREPKREEILSLDALLKKEEDL